MSGPLKKAGGLALLLALKAVGQDPFVVSPEHYKLELDNDWVQVARVSYRPHDTAPVHDHPKHPAIYIYLTGGGPIVFTHDTIGKVTRPAVKAGQLRYARPTIEKHEVQYLGSIATEYLRIELKTESPDLMERDVRMPEFENSQVRVIRMSCGGGQSCPSVSLPDVPVILVNLTDHSFQWIAPLTPATVLPQGDYIRIELKTKPRAF